MSAFRGGADDAERLEYMDFLYFGFMVVGSGSADGSEVGSGSDDGSGSGSLLGSGSGSLLGSGSGSLVGSGSVLGSGSGSGFPSTDLVVGALIRGKFLQVLVKDLGRQPKPT